MSMGQELKDFVAAFNTGANLWQRKKWYDLQKAYLDLKMKDLAGKTDFADRVSAVEKGLGSGASANSSISGDASGSTAAGDPVASIDDPSQKAFLNGISGPESSGKYNVRYTPKGGATFNGYDDHPRIYEPGPAGPSSAAGRYQITASTWDGLPSDIKQGGFTPENQDKAALYIAQRDYKANTGRDLWSDIKQEGFSPRIAKALGGTWTGLRDNPGKAASWFNNSLSRYDQQQDAAQDAEFWGDDGQSTADASNPQGYQYNSPNTADNVQDELQDREIEQGVQQNDLASADDDWGGGALDFSLFAARGGYVQSVKRFENGGFADNSDERYGNTPPMQAIPTGDDTTGSVSGGGGSSGGDTSQGNAKPGQPVSVPFVDVLHSGLTYLQDHFGLGKTGSAVPGTDPALQRRQAMAMNGAGATDDNDYNATLQRVDPNGELTDAQRHIFAMKRVYEFYVGQGDNEKAKAAAASMIQYSRVKSAQFADAAMKETDPQKRIALLSKAYSFVPDGKTVSVDMNPDGSGKYTQKDINGNIVGQGNVDPRMFFAAASGLKDGSLFWQEVMRTAGDKSNSADPEKKTEADKKRSAASDFDKSMNPAAPTKSPAKTSSSSDDDDDDDSSSSAGSSGAQTYPEGSQGDLMQDMTPDQRQKFLQLSPADRNIRQSMYRAGWQKQQADKARVDAANAKSEKTREANRAEGLGALPFTPDNGASSAPAVSQGQAPRSYLPTFTAPAPAPAQPAPQAIPTRPVPPQPDYQASPPPASAPASNAVPAAQPQQRRPVDQATLANARMAIRNGKSPAAVIQRIEAAGMYVDPKDLM